MATADRGDRDPAATDASTSKFAGLDALFGCALLVVIVAHSASVHDAVALAHPQFFGVAWRVGAALTRLDIGVDIAVMALAFRVYLPFARRMHTGRPSPETVRWWWTCALRIFPAYWIALCVVVGVSSRQSLRGTEQWLAHLTAIQGYVPSLWGQSTQGLRGGEFVGVIVSVAVAAPVFAYCARHLTRQFSAVTANVAISAMLVGCGAGFAALEAKHRLWAPLRVFSPYVALTAVGFSFADMFARRLQVPSSPRRSPFKQVQVRSRGLVRAMWAIALGLYIVMVQTVASHPSRASSVGELVAERWLRLVIAALVVSSVINVEIYEASESIARSASNPLPRWSLVAAMRRLGVVAFGAYLWHWVIIDALRARVGANSWLSFAFIALVTAASSAVFGIVSSSAIDRPIMRGFARRSSPAVLGLCAIGEKVVGRRAETRFMRGLVAIAAAGLAWRVTYVLTHVGRRVLGGDSFYYHWQANDVARGRWFIDPVQLRFYGRVTPSAFHPPSYVTYLALVSRFVSQSELAHRLASTVLGAATVFVIGMLARQLFRTDAAGWTAAAIGAVYAHLWINDEMLLSESMAQLWTILALIAVFRFWHTPRTRTALWMGAAVAGAVLSRAEALTLFPLLVVPIALRVDGAERRGRIKLAAIACGIGALILAPWLAFNAMRFEHPVALSNGIGSVLMVSNCDTTYGNLPHATPDRTADLGYWSLNCVNEFGLPVLQHGDESEKEVVWRKYGLDYMKSHASQIPEMIVYRVARMWDVGFLAQNVHPFNAFGEGRGDWQATLATLQYVILAPCALFGLGVLRRRKITIWPFFAIAITITITAAATFGITRYRAPVDAFLPVLAAGFVTTRLASRSRVEQAS